MPTARKCRILQQFKCKVNIYLKRKRYLTYFTNQEAQTGHTCKQNNKYLILNTGAIFNH